MAGYISKSGRLGPLSWSRYRHVRADTAEQARTIPQTTIPGVFWEFQLSLGATRYVTVIYAKQPRD
jgi:hypothetical protein